MIIVDILAGLAGAVAGFLGVGFLAARVLVAALGNHDGGSDMAGFFFFGPIGGLAGAMLGVGLAMRLGAGSKRCVLNAWIAALGPMNNFRVRADLGQKTFRCILGVPALVNGALDWSEWRSGGGSRIRSRIVNR
jgi:hypothetical protein